MVQYKSEYNNYIFITIYIFEEIVIKILTDFFLGMQEIHSNMCKKRKLSIH